MKSADIRIIENLACDSNVFDIRWKVTSLCNYACAFCIQGDQQAHRAEARGESAQLRAEICGELIRLIEALDGYEAVNISMLGGELAVLGDFPDILARMASCRFPGRINFSMTTNFPVTAAGTAACTTSSVTALREGCAA